MTVISYSDHSVYIKTLAATIRLDSSSTGVQLQRIVLNGDQDDLLDLANSFRGHPTLEQVEFTDVVCRSGTLDFVLQMILVSVPHLKLIRLNGIAISNPVIAAIFYCPSLRQLDLVRCNFNDQHAAALSLALLGNKGMESVDLTGNDMSDVGIVAFTQLLDKNVTLKALRLDGNDAVSPKQRAVVERKLREHMAKAA